MSNEYTPGPWRAKHYKHSNLWSIIQESVLVAEIYDSTRTPQERAANAKLIAASPDLLEACKRVLRESQDGYRVTSGAEADLYAAILKAEGE